MARRVKKRNYKVNRRNMLKNLKRVKQNSDVLKAITTENKI
jgi:hypothetical protein